MHTCLHPYIPYSAICNDAELQEMAKRLPSTFKGCLSDSRKKILEYQFHSANYYLMIEVVTALKTLVEELIKALEAEVPKDFGIEKLTAPQFMANLYENLDESDVLREIGVQNASPSHLDCLNQLPLTATYSCLMLFFHWVDDGFYDFKAIPFPFKVHMNQQDQRALSFEQICPKWTSTNSKLMEEVQELIDALKKSEQDIINRVNAKHVSPN